MADLGSIWLVWKIASRSQQIKVGFATLLLMALCPASIMISGIHGNLDPLMIFMALLSVFLITKKQFTWLAAIALGMAMNVKVAPMIFAPAMFFYFPNLRRRMQFFGTALGVFLVGSLPYLLQNPVVAASVVFGYAGMYGHWGWRLLFVLAQPDAFRSRERVSSTGFAWLHEAAQEICPDRLNTHFVDLDESEKESAPALCSGWHGRFLFMFLTPGFGAQYLSWLVPWVVAAGWRPTVVFYLTSGAYLLAAYGCVAQVFGCDSYLFFGLMCWASIPLVLFAYWGRMSYNASTVKISALD